MSSRAREDVELPYGGTFTFKEMPNGEMRRRFVSPNGTRMSETVGPDWDSTEGNFPWQDAHYHRGLTEHYFVQSGWVGFLFEKDGKLQWQRVETGGHICFPPLVAHKVLMGPQAVMATLLLGTSIGNSERKEDDWWPVPNEYLWELEKIKIEETFRL